MMKLLVPAVRASEPDAHRQEVADHTMELLGAIDALLAETCYARAARSADDA